MEAVHGSCMQGRHQQTDTHRDMHTHTHTHINTHGLVHLENDRPDFRPSAPSCSHPHQVTFPKLSFAKIARCRKLACGRGEGSKGGGLQDRKETRQPSCRRPLDARSRQAYGCWKKLGATLYLFAGKSLRECEREREGERGREREERVY